VLTGECEVVAARELGPAELACWEALRSVVPSWESPFLSAAFTMHVAAVREDTRVAVLRGGGPSAEIAGFLPFHSGPTRLGRPIGRKLSDAQGPIVDRELDWDPRDVVRAGRLRALAFDHLVGGHAAFAPFVRASDPSPQLDLSGGFDAFFAAARAEGRGGPNEAARKLRRLERDHGVRFTWNERDPAVLRTLLAWKSEQYRRTGAFDQMRRPWVVELLERLHASEDPHCAGILSTLHVGDDLVALDFGLRSGAHLASWFPAYDLAWAKHSPGNVLLLHTARAAAAAGVQRLDLGKGAETYKDRWATGGTTLESAVVPGGRAGAALTTAGRLAWGLARRTPAQARASRLRWQLDVG
jgi:CelD/BcsL family acetyltransferase involved in cellulose biosynthesis